MKQSSKMTLEDIGGLLSKLAEKSESVYWLSTPDLKKIQYISPAYEKIWGRSRDELYREPEKWITFLHPDDARDHHPIHELQKHIAQQGVNVRYEEDYRIVRPDGEIRWIIDRGFPILDEQGKCCGVSGVAIDVTKEKKVEEELRKAKKATEAANLTKYNFLHDMEYDIRTAFTGLYGLAKELNFKCETADKEGRDDKLSDPEIKELVNMMFLASTQLLDFCISMIDSARHESGIHPVVDHRFDLKDLLDGVISTYKPAALDKKLNLLFDYPSDMPTTFICDNYRLKCILMNLIGNAIKFTDKGQVKLSVHAKKKNENKWILQFCIEDTGIGIAPEHQDLVYEKFSKLHRAHEKQYPGLGLGLHVVKHLLNELGGEIELKSQPDKGSTFSFLLPMKRPLLDD